MLLAVLAVVLLSPAASCGSKPSLNYKAAGVVAGEARVKVGEFAYKPYLDGQVSRNQAQASGATLLGEKYTENIDEFVARALAEEMERSGYRVSTTSTQEIGGTVLAFEIDYGPKGNRVNATVQITFSVQNGNQETFAYAAAGTKEYRSVLGGASPKDMLTDMTRECFAQFLSQAEAEGVLTDLGSEETQEAPKAPETKDDIY
jgi:hypothetical protein